MRNWVCRRVLLGRVSDLDEQSSELIHERLLRVARQIRPAESWLEPRRLCAVMLPAFHVILRRRVERTSSSEDGAKAVELQPGLIQQLRETQQGLGRAMRINAEGQAFHVLQLRHPQRNGEPSTLELDFDMHPAIEPMRSKDVQFLEKQWMKRIKHRNFTRIAGIIAAGLSAHLTNQTLIPRAVLRLGSPSLLRQGVSE